MEFKTFVELNTIHITETDNDILTKVSDDPEFGLFPIYAMDEGWFVGVVSTDYGGCTPRDLAAAGFSIAFCSVYEKANAADCSAIIFDPDGDIDPELETFDW